MQPSSQNHHLLRIVCWTLFVLWACAIFVLSSLSGKQIEPWMLRIPNWDKVCHTIAFSVGALILAFALRQSTGWRMRMIVPVVIAIIAIFGATDEWHQLYTPGRSGADVWDWLADVSGATLGAFVSYVGQRNGKSTRASRRVAARD